MNKLIIGLDGYDSNFSGCTTHFTLFFLHYLKKSLKQFRLIGDPLLVRLNPNIPFKTRGNASVSVMLEGNLSYEDVLRAADEASMIYSFEKKGTIAVAMLDYVSDEKKRRVLSDFYRKSVTDFVPHKLAEEIAEEVGVAVEGYKSLVGALASIGYAFSGDDSTFELLAYRDPRNMGERSVDREYVARELLAYESLFNNVGKKKNRLVAIPRGPDPVLIGIRGIDKRDLLKAFVKISPHMEKSSSWCVFRSNQHTDPHAIPRKIGELRVYRMGVIEGVVVGKPVIKKGGHAFLRIKDASGDIEVAFYKETNPMNVVASKLISGDVLRVLGGAVDGKGDEAMIFEAEKLWVLRAPDLEVKLNPKCPKCGARMESAGKEKGFKCPKCGYRFRGKLEKETIFLKRELPSGPISPLEGRLRHIVKPPELDGRPLPRVNFTVTEEPACFF